MVKVRYRWILALLDARATFASPRFEGNDEKILYRVFFLSLSLSPFAFRAFLLSTLAAIFPIEIWLDTDRCDLSISTVYHRRHASSNGQSQKHS